MAAVTPPSASNNSFSNYNVPLYVPEESAESYYNSPRCWYRFEPEPMKVINNVTIEGIGDIANVPTGTPIKLVAVFEPSDATLPYIFWRSTNPDLINITPDGEMTVNPDFSDVSTRKANASRECQVIAETMYADGPQAVITFKGNEVIGIETIKADGGNIQDTVVNRSNDIYTPQGVLLKRAASQADIDALTPGLYIIGGKKVLVR